MSALLRKPGFKFGSLFAAMFLLAAGLFVYAAENGGGQNNVTLSLTRAPGGDKLDHGTKVDVAASVDCSGADIILKITFLAYDQGPELDEDPSIVIYESPAGTKDQDSYQIDTGARKPGSYWIEATSSKASNSPQTDYFTIGQYLPGDAPSCWIHFDSGDAYKVGASWYIKHGGTQSVRCEPTDKDKDYQGNELDDTFDSSNAYRWYCAEGGEFDPQKSKESTWTAPIGNETKANVQCYIDDDGKYYNDLELPTLVDHGTVVVHLFTLDSVALDKSGMVKYEEGATLKATASYRGDIPGGKLRYVLIKDGEEQDGVEDGSEHTFQISEPGKYSVKVFFDEPSTGAQSVYSSDITFWGVSITPSTWTYDYNPGAVMNNSEEIDSLLGDAQSLANRATQLAGDAETAAKTWKMATGKWPRFLKFLNARGISWKPWMGRWLTAAQYVSAAVTIAEHKSKVEELKQKEEEIQEKMEKVRELLQQLEANHREDGNTSVNINVYPEELSWSIGVEETNMQTTDPKFNTLTPVSVIPWRGTGDKDIELKTLGNLGSRKFVVLVNGEVGACLQVEVKGLTKEEAWDIVDLKIEQQQNKLDQVEEEINNVLAITGIIFGILGAVIAYATGVGEVATVIAIIFAIIGACAWLARKLVEFFQGDDLKGRIDEEYPSGQ